MIRKYKLLTKGGIMDQAMKQAIETFKENVF